MAESVPARRYPLHWACWSNDLNALKVAVAKAGAEINLESKDPRGRTPLQLAVCLGNVDCLRYLVSLNANVNIEDNHGFNVLHETISSLGDPELVRDVLERRDYQRYSSRIDGVPALLRKLRDTPDFYCEMSWQFISWVPLVARMCPSDTYKIYKSGSSVRIDTTLLGFDQSNWQRGSRSYIFKGHEEGAVFMEVDHDTSQVSVEAMKVLAPDSVETVHLLKPPPEVVQARMTSPMSTTYLDCDKISFERTRAGIIGFRTDRTDVVNGYECRVFTASNVEIVTKMRTEHLSAEDKARHKEANASRLSPFQSLLGMVETDEKPVEDEATTTTTSSTSVSPVKCRNPHNARNITAEEYFDATFDLKGRDIGRGREINTRTQKFKANLWLCENYPLSLQEQVLPIIDLMAISSSHFAKLRDFITLQLPAGFPVKIEIPLFHVLNARITFGNIFSLEEPVTGVTAIKDEAATACVVDETVFEPPSSYSVRGSDESGRQWSANDDDELVQMAMQQYLVDEGNDSDQVTFFEALRTQQPDADLQRAIQESLAEFHMTSGRMDPSPPVLPPPPSSASSSHNGSLTAEGRSSPPPTTTSPSESDPSAVCPTVANGHIPRQHPATRPLPAVVASQADEWVVDDLELALRLSRQDQDEADRQRRQEEEVLQQILALSMTEK